MLPTPVDRPPPRTVLPPSPCTTLYSRSSLSPDQTAPTRERSSASPTSAHALLLQPSFVHTRWADSPRHSQGKDAYSFHQTRHQSRQTQIPLPALRRSSPILA